MLGHGKSGVTLLSKPRVSLLGSILWSIGLFIVGLLLGIPLQNLFSTSTPSSVLGYVRYAFNFFIQSFRFSLSVMFPFFFHMFQLYLWLMITAFNRVLLSRIGDIIELPPGADLHTTLSHLQEKLSETLSSIEEKHAILNATLEVLHILFIYDCSLLFFFRQI